MIIKILIVNDSIMVQQLLKRVIESDSQFRVVGIANDGLEGIRFATELNPDVILMDIRMPKCDGVAATRQIMQDNPRPILIVTATIHKNMSYIYDCLAYGALEVLRTPSGEANGAELIKRIKIVNALKSMVERKAPPLKVKTEEAKVLRPKSHQLIKGKLARKVVVVGASTGGPRALEELLKALPQDLGAGLIILQHIDPEFVSGLADWFNTSCPIEIMSAQEGDYILNDHGYVACRDLIVNQECKISYQNPSPTSFYTPNIDLTFESVSEIYGNRAVGVLLTGMGADGAKGLKKIRQAGGRTIAQDEKTSMIYGMPKAAAEIGAAEFVLPLDKIAGKIVELLAT